MSVAGKSVLITGASKGIGKATAQYLALQGAKVALMARSTDQLVKIAEDIGENAIAISGDVAEYEDVQKAIRTTVDTFGHINILINNAGLLHNIGHLADVPPVAWGQIMDVNVKGVFNTCHAAIPSFLEQNGGTIINISSGAAYKAYEGWSHYCASKAAVLQITRSVHLEYGAQGIRSIGLSPSTIATDMQVDIKASGMNPVSEMDASDHNPPIAVAKIIEYLCGPAGNPHCGQDFMLKSPEGLDILRQN